MLLLSYFYQRGVSKNTPPPPQEQKPVSTPPRNQDPVMPTPGTIQPRGIRNNNPLNIEFNPANQWQGQTGTDGRFAIFSSAYYGIRAAGRLMKNYRDKHGLNTTRGIISRWAPAVENNVTAYLNSVTKRTGFFPDLILNQNDYPKLIEAMIQHENGTQPYAMNLITQAVFDGFN
ncbi:MAG: virion protein [Alishewanella aestuarii]